MSIAFDAPKLKSDIKTAIVKLRAKIRWKPGKDLQHLKTRIGYRHLPESATLALYEAIIAEIILDHSAEVYAYIWDNAVYATIVANHENRCWLVMFSLDGILETAFPPTDPGQYLADSRFRQMGTVEEIMV